MYERFCSDKLICEGAALIPPPTALPLSVRVGAVISLGTAATTS